MKIKHLVHAFVASLIIILIVVYVFNPAGFFHGMQLHDIVMSGRTDDESIPADTNIVIVNFGTLDRAGIAKELDIINQYGPRVVGIDALFRSRKADSLDIPLIHALRNTKKLVLGAECYEKYKDDIYYMDSSLAVFSKNAVNAHVNIYSANNICRGVSPVVETAQRPLPCFALAIAEYFAPEKAAGFAERNNEYETISLMRNADKYTVLDIKDVFGRKNLEVVKDKIVLFGFVDKSGKLAEDIFFTPMNSSVFGPGRPDMYGVIFQANVISMILEENYIDDFRNLPDFIILLIYFILVFITIILLMAIGIKKPGSYRLYSFLFTAAEILLLALINLGLFRYCNISFPFYQFIVFVLLTVPFFHLYLWIAGKISGRKDILSDNGI